MDQRGARTANRFRLKYDQFLLIIALLLSMPFLGISNYHFVRSVSASLKKTQTNYGETSVYQVSESLERQFDLLSSALPSLIAASFSDSELNALSGMNHADSEMFRSHCAQLLVSLKAINGSVGGLLLFGDGGVRSFGDAPALFGVSSSEIASHWRLGVADQPTTLLFPHAPVYTENLRLSALEGRIKLLVPVARKDGAQLYLCVLMSMDYFARQVESIRDIAITGHDGVVLYNNTTLSDEELASVVEAQESGASSYAVLYAAQPQMLNPLTILHVYDTGLMRSQLDRVGRTVLLFDAAILLLSLLAARVMSTRITAPFRMLAASVGSYPETVEFPEAKKPRRLRLSLRENLFYYLLIVVLPSFVAFSAVSVSFYANTAQTNLHNATRISFLQTYSGVQELFDNAASVSKAIALDREVQAYVSEMQRPAFNWKPQSMDYFYAKADIALYNSLGEAVYLSDTDSFPEAGIDVDRLSGFHEWSTISIGNETYLQFLVPFRDVESMRVIGYLLCRIEELALVRRYIDLLAGGGEAFLVAEDGSIASHRLASMQGSAIDPVQLARADAGNELDFLQQVKGTPYTFVLLGDTMRLEEEQRSFLISTLYLSIAVLFVVFIVSLMLAHYISRYFRRMSLRFAAYSPETVDPDINESSLIDEVNHMNVSFHEMTVRIRQLLEEALRAAERQHQLESDHRRVEIALLQAQINPHFLCNTFESINFFIRNGESEKAINMISSLAAMFRFAARENRDIIPLFNELDYARQYVEVMQTRFSDVFSASFNIPGDFRGCDVPRFILQPIIENAITHALIPKGQGGHLEVSCRGTDKRLYLVIRDDGIGMDEESMQRLTGGLCEKKPNSSIGLYNIHNRLRLLFGKPYGINVASRPGEGTTVVITLPRDNMADKAEKSEGLHC